MLQNPPRAQRINNGEAGMRHGDSMSAYIEQMQSDLKSGGLDKAQAHEAIRRRLIQEMPSMESIIKTGGYTAIVAANDAVAAQCFFWLRYTGRKVPEDFSIVSFDNHPNFAMMEFSNFIAVLMRGRVRSSIRRLQIDHFRAAFPADVDR